MSHICHVSHMPCFVKAFTVHRGLLGMRAGIYDPYVPYMTHMSLIWTSQRMSAWTGTPAASRPQSARGLWYAVSKSWRGRICSDPARVGNLFVSSAEGPGNMQRRRRRRRRGAGRFIRRKAMDRLTLEEEEEQQQQREREREFY